MKTDSLWSYRTIYFFKCAITFGKFNPHFNCARHVTCVMWEHICISPPHLIFCQCRRKLGICKHCWQIVIQFFAYRLVHIHLLVKLVIKFRASVVANPEEEFIGFTSNSDLLTADVQSHVSRLMAPQKKTPLFTIVLYGSKTCVVID